MERRKIAAGNWKMNKTWSEARELAEGLGRVDVPRDVEVILAPPSLYLNLVAESVCNNDKINVAAQNCHQEAKGAYTGEVSSDMLAAMDVPYVIIGHSERRTYFHEDDALLAAKVIAALNSGLSPIFCCGEPLEIRKAGDEVAYVSKQIEAALFQLSVDQLERVIVAYEPIWAIGTGETASPEQAQEMHAAIRKLLGAQYGEAVAQKISILYGGSVKPANAKALFGQADVDGGLVGGASLKVDDFAAIIQSF